jgi:hypothetical protein
MFYGHFFIQIFNYMCHTGPLEVAISGGVAGACFWASVFPTDVVKSRVQVSAVTALLLFVFS